MVWALWLVSSKASLFRAGEGDPSRRPGSFCASWLVQPVGPECNCNCNCNCNVMRFSFFFRLNKFKECNVSSQATALFKK